MTKSQKITIIGGGLAGLTSAILLAKDGFQVELLEKKKYPFHRVCGEYISNEVVDFLNREELYPSEFNPSIIEKFELTSVSGNGHTIKLPMGGFGISRYSFDYFLAEKAKRYGVALREGISVQSVNKVEDGSFQVILQNGESFTTDLVIGAFGKRSNLDNYLKRSFFRQSSPYVGVKYHLKIDHPPDTISLHNFKNGYCGISEVEGGTLNLCYLSHVNNLKKAGSIQQMERQVLFENPEIHRIFTQGEFLFEKPLAIHEVSFRPKALVENGIIMCGDSAGLITPLCGNGMAMAIHSAKILRDAIVSSRKNGSIHHVNLIAQYSKAWKAHFALRLRVGRTFQSLFGGKLTSELAVTLLKSPLAQSIVALTHGTRF